MSRSSAERQSIAGNRVRTAIVVLSLVGLGVAVYLAVTYGLDRSPYCAGSSGCDVVRTSRFVVVIPGFLSVPILGVIGFAAVLMLALLRPRIQSERGHAVSFASYGVALVGFLYSGLYLTGLELFVIHALCYWCIATSIVMTAIFALTIVDLLRVWSTVHPVSQRPEAHQ